MKLWLTHSLKMSCLTIYTYKAPWHPWLWEILIIVPNHGPSPLLTFNQSFWCQPMKGAEGWRRTELLDGAFWRAVRRTERHISPNAHQTFGREEFVLQKRPVRECVLIFFLDMQRWRDFWQWILVQFDLIVIPSESTFSSFPIFSATDRGMEQAPSAPSPPPKPVNHEPISFGIDQILGAGSEPESGRTPGRQSGSDLSNGDAYYSLGNPSVANAPSYTALSISLSGIMPPADASGSYGENRSLGSRGVIRVPAHRPVTAPGPSAPVQSAVPGFGGLCFPWIGNRFAKDRISGRPAGRPNGIPSLIFDYV